MSDLPSQARHKRTDALQNRAKIITVAIGCFQANGAGLRLMPSPKKQVWALVRGNATFRDVMTLLAAALATRESALLVKITTIAAMHDPLDALHAWFENLQEYLSSFSMVWLTR